MEKEQNKSSLGKKGGWEKLFLKQKGKTEHDWNQILIFCITKISTPLARQLNRNIYTNIENKKVDSTTIFMIERYWGISWKTVNKFDNSDKIVKFLKKKKNFQSSL